MTYTIRKAQAGDAESIYRLLEPLAAQGEVLPRSREDILKYCHCFQVAASDPALENKCVGCVALHPYGGGLYEVRSLAVSQRHRGAGLGKTLVEAAVQEAMARGAHRLFALTRRPGFFEKVGFTRTAKSAFPQKVWRDCVQCARREQCDEIALVREVFS